MGNCRIPFYCIWFVIMICENSRDAILVYQLLKNIKWGSCIYFQATPDLTQLLLHILQCLVNKSYPAVIFILQLIQNGCIKNKNRHNRFISRKCLEQGCIIE